MLLIARLLALFLLTCAFSGAFWAETISLVGTDPENPRKAVGITLVTTDTTWRKAETTAHFFKTTGGTYIRHGNNVELRTRDTSQRVGILYNLPNDVKKGATGSGLSDETGRKLDWTVQ